MTEHERQVEALVVAMARLVLSEQQVAGAKLEHGLAGGGRVSRARGGVR